MRRWLLLSAIFVLSACGNEAQPIEESRSLNEIEVSSFNGRSAIETHDNVDEMEAIECCRVSSCVSNSIILCNYYRSFWGFVQAHPVVMIIFA